uniref:Uncharacterized protein n=1 Tax=Arundo donax TaxID=35708 RepID=A0A0A9EHV8_ARUDO
MIHKNGSLNTV